MKRTPKTFFAHLLSAGLGLIVLQCPSKLAAQYIHKIVVTPSNPLPSDTVRIAVNGDLPSTGIFLADRSMSIIGNMIQIRLNFDAIGEIVLPVLVPYSSSFKVGKLLSGNYTVQAKTYFQWQPTDSAAATFTVQSPTNVDQKARFLTQNPTIHLLQNYPNPFNPETSISYALPKQAHVVLKVYDILGRQVRTLVNEIRPTGRHRVIWNGRDDRGLILPSGIYLYRIQAGEFEVVRKMLLAK